MNEFTPRDRQDIQELLTDVRKLREDVASLSHAQITERLGSLEGRCTRLEEMVNLVSSNPLNTRVIQLEQLIRGTGDQRGMIGRIDSQQAQISSLAALKPWIMGIAIFLALIALAGGDAAKIQKLLEVAF